MPAAPIPSLDPSLCRARQNALRTLLEEKNLGAALFINRHYVHALTGYWHEQPLTLAAVIVATDGKTTVAAPGDSVDAPAADQQIPYDPQRLCTLIENIEAELIEALSPALAGFKRIGAGASVPSSSLNGSAAWVDITTAYQFLRRRKDSDELALLRHSIRGAEAAFAEARRHLVPGITEIEIYAAMQSAAVTAVGELLSAWGNDFQSGSPGGVPRQRPTQAGELAILDVGVGYRGYRSDLCRSFAVDGTPSKAQQAAHARVLEALDHAEKSVRPGVSCKTLFDEIHAMLDGWNGYRFFHHLGHGIGLDAHEVPRLNPNWDDTFHEGDVVAVEPGLYGRDLRAGIRLEQNYLVTDSGIERLSHFPLEL